LLYCNSCQQSNHICIFRTMWGLRLEGQRILDRLRRRFREHVRVATCLLHSWGWAHISILLHRLRCICGGCSPLWSGACWGLPCSQFLSVSHVSARKTKVRNGEQDSSGLNNNKNTALDKAMTKYFSKNLRSDSRKDQNQWVGYSEREEQAAECIIGSSHSIWLCTCTANSTVKATLLKKERVLPTSLTCLHPLQTVMIPVPQTTILHSHNWNLWYATVKTSLGIGTGKEFHIRTYQSYAGNSLNKTKTMQKRQLLSLIQTGSMVGLTNLQYTKSWRLCSCCEARTKEVGQKDRWQAGECKCRQRKPR